MPNIAWYLITATTAALLAACIYQCWIFSPLSIFSAACLAVTSGVACGRWNKAVAAQELMALASFEAPVTAVIKEAAELDELIEPGATLYKICENMLEAADKAYASCTPPNSPEAMEIFAGDVIQYEEKLVRLKGGLSPYAERFNNFRTAANSLYNRLSSEYFNARSNGGRVSARQLEERVKPFKNWAMGLPYLNAERSQVPQGKTVAERVAMRQQVRNRLWDYVNSYNSSNSF